MLCLGKMEAEIGAKRQKRQDLTHAQKAELVQIAQAHPGWTQARIAGEFASRHKDTKVLNRTTISKVLKRKDSVIGGAPPLNPSSKRAKESKWPQLDQLLWSYFRQASAAARSHAGECECLR